MDAAFVRRIMALARVEVDEEALPELVPQLERIFELVSTVQRIPMTSAGAPQGRVVGIDALRADVPGPLLGRREMNRNAPEHDGAFLVVPKFLADAD